MAEFPAMPLWTDAYLADTRHLNHREHGCYFMLLLEMWRSPACQLIDDRPVAIDQQAKRLGVDPGQIGFLQSNGIRVTTRFEGYDEIDLLNEFFNYCINSTREGVVVHSFPYWVPYDGIAERHADWARHPCRFLDAKWRDVRSYVLENHHGGCVSCGGSEQLEVDHIVPRSKGGTHALDNLQVLCITCNRRKGDRL